jgi:hypothetical protein
MDEWVSRQSPAGNSLWNTSIDHHSDIPRR